MSVVVIYDKDTNRVLEYWPSAHTPDYDKRADALINPDVSKLLTTSVQYWKVADGKVAEMTVNEKATVDSEKPSDEITCPNCQHVFSLP